MIIFTPPPPPAVRSDVAFKESVCKKKKKSCEYRTDIGQSHKARDNTREKGNSCVDHTRATVLNLFHGILFPPLYFSRFSIYVIYWPGWRGHGDFTKSAIDSLSLSLSLVTPVSLPLLSVSIILHSILHQAPQFCSLQVSLYSPFLSSDVSLFLFSFIQSRFTRRKIARQTNYASY